MSALRILLLVLALAAPAAAFDPDVDFDPTKWQRVTEDYVPLFNSSGIDGRSGTNTPGNGRLGWGDVAYWSWNLPNDPFPQRAPGVWHPIDVTKTWWNESTGIPKTVKAVWIHVQVIMTPGMWPYYSSPAIQYQFRGAGTLDINPAKTPTIVVGARLPNTILVPVHNGKIEFRYFPSPYPQPEYYYDSIFGPLGGATFGQHIIVLEPKR